jgi:hypothetical protein
MKIRSKNTLRMKKGEIFHLDQWFALSQGNNDLWHQILKNNRGEIVDENSDTCTTLKSFEITVIVKTNDGK